jgi:hypothetical protein
MVQGGGSPAAAPPDRLDARAALKLVIGLVAVFVAVLAVVALLNSFFIEPQTGQNGPEPGPGPTQGPTEGPVESPGQSPGQSPGGGQNVTCQNVVDSFFWGFVGLSAFTLVFLGLAVAFRQKSGGRILTSGWGIVAMVGLFFALLAAAAWKLMDWICNGAPSCTELVDGTYVTFIVLFVVTVGSVAFGITLAHLRRIHFFRTGLGVLGVVLFLPTILTGVLWFFIRLFCNPDLLSCAYIQDTMDNLGVIFFVGLVGGLLAMGVGVVVKVRLGLGLFRSGWAVLAILLLVLAVMSGIGYLFVDGIHQNVCKPQELPEDSPTPSPEEPPECQEIMDNVAIAFWITLALAVVLLAVSFVFNHNDMRGFLTSPWAIIAYVLLGIALIIGLSWLALASICPGEGDGTGGGDGGDQGGGDGGGGGGGGGGSGPGGGSGGTGNVPAPRPVNFSPLPLTWVLVILAIVLAVAVLMLLLRRRQRLGPGGGAPTAPASEISPAEQYKLMQILDKRKLASREAIVAAYRVFLAWSAGHGLRKDPSETPAEHARRVRADFPVPERSMGEFIQAYEVARLSGREPTPEERRLAVQFSKEILETKEPAEESKP